MIFLIEKIKDTAVCQQYPLNEVYSIVLSLFITSK